MSIKIETPPVLAGATENQLRQVYGYLFRLSEHLNVALGSLDQTEAELRRATVGRNGQSAEAEFEKPSRNYNELRALIVNTAETVSNTMTVLRNDFFALEQGTRSDVGDLSLALRNDMTAISNQWGAFQQTVGSEMKVTAESVLASYDYDSQLQTLREQAAGFSEYKIHTEGFIRQGFIEYDSSGIPILGIAIGQGLTSTTVTINGEEYLQFDATQSCAFYTADRVSFRINGQEVAYISNQKLYIQEAEITTGTVTLGGAWKLSTGSGFAIKYIGGA